MKKRIKRAFACGIAVFLAVLSAAVAINIAVVKGAREDIYSAGELCKSGERFDAILIFGAGVRADGSPSAMLAERLECGRILYENGISEKIIVSGDHGSVEYDEVNTMKSYLVAAGIPAENIFMDHAGFSTFDSLYRAKHIFMCESVCAVTQRYHLYRALDIAKAIKISAAGCDAQKRGYYGRYMRELRECAARVKDFLFSRLGGMPQYLGEVIPVSGDGNVTNDKRELYSVDEN